MIINNDTASDDDKQCSNGIEESSCFSSSAFQQLRLDDDDEKDANTKGRDADGEEKSMMMDTTDNQQQQRQLEILVQHEKKLEELWEHKIEEMWKSKVDMLEAQLLVGQKQQQRQEMSWMTQASVFGLETAMVLLLLFLLVSCFGLKQWTNTRRMNRETKEALAKLEEQLARMAAKQAELMKEEENDGCKPEEKKKQQHDHEKTTLALVKKCTDMERLLTSLSQKEDKTRAKTVDVQEQLDRLQKVVLQVTQKTIHCEKLGQAHSAKLAKLQQILLATTTCIMSTEKDDDDDDIVEGESESGDLSLPD